MNLAWGRLSTLFSIQKREAVISTLKLTTHLCLPVAAAMPKLPVMMSWNEKRDKHLVHCICSIKRSTISILAACSLQILLSLHWYLISGSPQRKPATSAFVEASALNDLSLADSTQPSSTRQNHRVESSQRRFSGLQAFQLQTKQN